LNEWVISLVAALAAVGALVFTGYAFKRLRKTEQVRLSESILKDVRNSINEYNILFFAYWRKYFCQVQMQS